MKKAAPKRDVQGAQGIHCSADAARLARADALIAARLERLAAAGFRNVRLSRGQLVGALIDAAYEAEILGGDTHGISAPTAAPTAPAAASRPVAAHRPADALDLSPGQLRALGDDCRKAVASGISCRQIGDAAGIDRDRVSHFTRGRPLRPDEARALRAALSKPLALPAPSRATTRSKTPMSKNKKLKREIKNLRRYTDGIARALSEARGRSFGASAAALAPPSPPPGPAPVPVADMLAIEEARGARADARLLQGFQMVQSVLQTLANLQHRDLRSDDSPSSAETGGGLIDSVLGAMGIGTAVRTEQKTVDGIAIEYSASDLRAIFLERESAAQTRLTAAEEAIPVLEQRQKSEREGAHKRRTYEELPEKDRQDIANRLMAVSKALYTYNEAPSPLHPARQLGSAVYMLTLSEDVTLHMGEITSGALAVFKAGIALSTEQVEIILSDIRVRMTTQAAAKPCCPDCDGAEHEGKSTPCTDNALAHAKKTAALAQRELDLWAAVIPRIANCPQRLSLGQVALLHNMPGMAFQGL